MRMMALEHYGRYRWVQAPIAALAMWLIASPFTGIKARRYEPDVRQDAEEQE